ncbi:MAG: hypothetical protein AB8G22_21250, partial [Saprospiraceae bacterium]
MKNFIIFIAAIFISIYGHTQATLSLEVIAIEGDFVDTTFFSSFNNPTTNPQGQVGFSFTRVDEIDSMWFDDAPVFNANQDTNVDGTFERSSGIGSDGKFLIGPSFDDADAVYNQDGLILVKDTQAPGFEEGVNTTFHSRPFMSGDDNVYWIAGLNFTGGTSSEDRVLYQLVNDVPIPVYSSNDLVIAGFPLKNGGAGLDFDFIVSNNNQHLIQVMKIETGS